VKKLFQNFEQEWDHLEREIEEFTNRDSVEASDAWTATPVETAVNDYDDLDGWSNDNDGIGVTRGRRDLLALQKLNQQLNTIKPVKGRFSAKNIKLVTGMNTKSPQFEDVETQLAPDNVLTHDFKTVPCKREPIKGVDSGTIPYDYGKKCNDDEACLYKRTTSDVHIYTCQPAPICCKALIAQCYACQKGMSTEQYCVLHPMTNGCPNAGCGIQTTCNNCRNAHPDCAWHKQTTYHPAFCANHCLQDGSCMRDYDECPVDQCSDDGNNYDIGKSFKNKCGEICTCESDLTLNCCRNRKSFLAMTQFERERYTRAVRDLTQGTNTGTAQLQADYNTLVQNHGSLFNHGIHWSTSFLPWHRWYIKEYEDLLRKVNECVTVPYWPWEQEADPWTSNLWKTTTDWFGNAGMGSCVYNGAFGFTTPGWVGPDGNCLKSRWLSGTVDDAGDIAGNVLNKSPFNWVAFTDAMESTHDNLHCTIGGWMCSSKAADAPEFFLHHANIDRLWDKWQKKSASHLHAQNTDPMYNTPLQTASGLHTAAGFTPRDLEDLSNHAGICVNYVKSNSIHEWIEDFFARFPSTFRWQNIRHVRKMGYDKNIQFYLAVKKDTPINQIEAEAYYHKTGRIGYIATRRTYSRRLAKTAPSFAGVAGQVNTNQMREKFGEFAGVSLDDILVQLLAVSPQLASDFQQSWTTFVDADTQLNQRLMREDESCKRFHSTSWLILLEAKCAAGLICDFDGASNEWICMKPKRFTSCSTIRTCARCHGHEQGCAWHVATTTHKAFCDNRCLLDGSCVRVGDTCPVNVCYDSGNTYIAGQTFSNSCGESCTCQADLTIDCCRIRKSYVTMSKSERERYNNAIVDLTQGNGPYTCCGPTSQTGRYEKMVQDHYDLFNAGIHWTSQFLPWHRWYLLKLENLIREAWPNRCVTIPYWAWELESNPWTSPLWGSTDDWFGGGSSGSNGGPPYTCVTDGPFRESVWETAGGICLTRDRTGAIEDALDIQTQILNLPSNDWVGFTNALEGVHDGVHCAIGGDYSMCSGEAADSPEFFLHHANIDRIWDKWQKQSAAHLSSQQATGAYTDPMQTNSGTHTADGYTPEQLTDLSDHIGTCVRYGRPYSIIGWIQDIFLRFPKDFPWDLIPHFQELDASLGKKFIKNVMNVDDQTADKFPSVKHRTTWIEERNEKVLSPAAVLAMKKDPFTTILTFSFHELTLKLDEYGNEDTMALLKELNATAVSYNNQNSQTAALEEGDICRKYENSHTSAKPPTDMPARCSAGLVCAKDENPATCNDGVQNSDETGLDCGGACPPCACTWTQVGTQQKFDVDEREITHEVTLQACKDECLAAKDCYGINVHRSNGRCWFTTESVGTVAAPILKDSNSYDAWIKTCNPYSDVIPDHYCPGIGEEGKGSVSTSELAPCKQNDFEDCKQKCSNSTICGGLTYTNSSTDMYQTYTYIATGCTRPYLREQHGLDTYLKTPYKQENDVEQWVCKKEQTCTVVIGTNHAHSMTPALNCGSMAGTYNLTLGTTLNGDHKHGLSLTTDNLQSIKNGETVIVDSTLDNNHIHSVTMKCLGCDRACCRALIAKCYACQADMSIDEYCAAHPTTAGCFKPNDDCSTYKSCGDCRSQGNNCAWHVKYGDHGAFCADYCLLDGSCLGINDQCPVKDQCFHNKALYKVGDIFTNGCSFKCTCEKDGVISCCRRRKSFTKMPLAEREKYTQAIRDLQSPTSALDPALKTRYQDLRVIHRDWFQQGIHWDASFLPWHRWYLLQFENLLMEIDECITVPYWSWETEGADPWASDLWGSTTDWFGQGSGNQCVPDGPFTFPFMTSNNACLKRRRFGGIDDAVDVFNFVLSRPASTSQLEWEQFTTALELIHDNVHCTIGGTMCTIRAADAPEFMLHHANIDRIWNKWQKKGHAYLNAQQYHSAYDIPMSLGGNPAKYSAQGASPEDMQDLTDHDGVCVSYENTLSFPEWIIDHIFLDPSFPKDFNWKKIRHVQPTDEIFAIEFMRNVAQRDITEATEMMQTSNRFGYLEQERSTYDKEQESLNLFTQLVGVDQNDLFNALSKNRDTHALSTKLAKAWKRYREIYEGEGDDTCLDLDTVCVEFDLMNPLEITMDRSSQCCKGLICDGLDINDNILQSKCIKAEEETQDAHSGGSEDTQILINTIGQFKDRCDCLDSDTSCELTIQQVQKIFESSYEQAWKTFVTACSSLECIAGDMNDDGKKNIMDIIALVKDVLSGVRRV